MIPVPSINFFPKVFRDYPDEALIALTNKLDDLFIEWFENAKSISNFSRVERCPSEFLKELGYLFGADISTYDDDREIRLKIYNAIRINKKRGTWVSHVKLIVDSIAGYDSRLYSLGEGSDPDDWILTGNGELEQSSNWAILGGDGEHPYGMYLIGEGSEIEIPGNIYVNCHFGIYTVVLTNEQVFKMVSDLKTFALPAYMRIYLGYLDESGVFIIYEGGTIG